MALIFKLLFPKPPDKEKRARKKKPSHKHHETTATQRRARLLGPCFFWSPRQGSGQHPPNQGREYRRGPGGPKNRGKIGKCKAVFKVLPPPLGARPPPLPTVKRSLIGPCFGAPVGGPGCLGTTQWDLEGVCDYVILSRVEHKETSVPNIKKCPWNQCQNIAIKRIYSAAFFLLGFGSGCIGSVAIGRGSGEAEVGHDLGQRGAVRLVGADGVVQQPLQAGAPSAPGLGPSDGPMWNDERRLNDGIVFSQKGGKEWAGGKSSVWDARARYPVDRWEHDVFRA